MDKVGSKKHLASKSDSFRVELTTSSFLDLIFKQARLNATVSGFLFFMLKRKMHEETTTPPIQSPIPFGKHLLLLFSCWGCGWFITLYALYAPCALDGLGFVVFQVTVVKGSMHDPG